MSPQQRLLRDHGARRYGPRRIQPANPPTRFLAPVDLPQHGLDAIGAAAPVDVPQHGLDAIGAALESREFHLTLDENAQIAKPILKQPFGFGLRDHQRVWIGALHARHADMADGLIARDEINRADLKSGIDKRRRSTSPVEQFQASAPQNQRLGFIGALGGLIDDANSHAVARQLRGHRHSDRPGANNQNRGHHSHPPSRQKFEGVHRSRQSLPVGFCDHRKCRLLDSISATLALRSSGRGIDNSQPDRQAVQQAGIGFGQREIDDAGIHHIDCPISIGKTNNKGRILRTAGGPSPVRLFPRIRLMRLLRLPVGVKQRLRWKLAAGRPQHRSV